MNKLMPYVVAPLFAVFGLAVAAAVMFYSFQAVSIIFPGDLLGQIFGMVLFDVAAFVWFATMIYYSVTIGEYVTALLGFLVGLFGTLGLIAIEISISLKIVSSAEVGKPLSYIFIAVLIGHLILIYARHASGEEVTAQISRGVDHARILKAAQKQADQLIEQNQGEVVSALAQQIARDALSAALSHRVGSGAVLDLKALPAEQETITHAGGGAAVQSFLSHIRAGWGKGGSRKFESAASAVENLKQDETSAIPAAEPAGLASGEKKKKK